MNDPGPRWIPLDSGLVIELTMPPVPCCYCGRDLRGQRPRCVEPFVSEDGDDAYRLACSPACPARSDTP